MVNAADHCRIWRLVCTSIVYLVSYFPTICFHTSCGGLYCWRINVRDHTWNCIFAARLIGSKYIVLLFNETDSRDDEQAEQAEEKAGWTLQGFDCRPGRAVETSAGDSLPAAELLSLRAKK